MFDLALSYLRGREFQMAADLCQDALAQEPRDDKMRVLFGTVLVRQNRFAEAETELRQVVARHPQIPKAQRELANELGEPRSANVVMLGALAELVGLRPTIMLMGVVAATGMMMVVAAFAKTPEQAGNLQAILAVGLGMLGGILVAVGLSLLVVVLRVDMLIGLAAVISVEPDPDDSAAPFALKPLIDMDIEDVGAGTLQAMMNNAASAPTGTATISND